MENIFPVYSMKAYAGSLSIAPFILNFTPSLLYPRERTPVMGREKSHTPIGI